MIPVSPVMPGSQSLEVTLGVGQPEYEQVPALYIDTECRPMITRWRLTDRERLMVLAGADIVLQQLTFQNPFQPVNLQVVMPNQNPVLTEEPRR